jgi:predicted DCC family thiol-disulfide oxidoreductase YuxK
MFAAKSAAGLALRCASCQPHTTALCPVREMENKLIVLFDGVCNFCNGSVNFIIERDPNHFFAFAPVQSQSGQALIKEFNVPEGGEDTFLLIKNGKCYFRTNAALEIAKNLTGAWFIFYILKIIP